MPGNNIFLAFRTIIMYNPSVSEHGRPVAAFVYSGCFSNREKRFCMICFSAEDSFGEELRFFVNILGKAVGNDRILAFLQVDNVKNPDYTNYNPP